MQPFRHVLLIFLLLTEPAVSWDQQLLKEPLVLDGRPVPYAEFAIYLMPGAPFEINYANPGIRGHVAFAGRVGPLSEFALRAPETPGIYQLTVTEAVSGEQMHVNVFTMTPAGEIDGGGRLNGYRIGAYPDEPLRGNDIYLPPEGFVEVTLSNSETRLSPNFTLGQFVSKQAQGYPKYVVLRANLLLKLENILATLNHSGRPTEGLVIMSGYRTPWYNRAIRNVTYSRHVWGGAADIYVDDTPRDGAMDDLNGDGKVNRGDARWLASFINDMSERGVFGPRIGGIGVYGSNAAHGPFVHVDVRGKRARW